MARASRCGFTAGVVEEGEVEAASLIEAVAGLSGDRSSDCGLFWSPARTADCLSKRLINVDVILSFLSEIEANCADRRDRC